MDIKEIQSLIRFVAKSGASEVSLEMEDVKITIKTGGATNVETTVLQQVPAVATQLAGMPQAMPAAVPAAAPAKESASEEESNDNYITVKSPIIGTFYKKPSPDKPAFVEVGSQVNQGDVLCVIEAMKLFNDIESEVSGKIVKILVEDASPVEFDQPLFLIDPS
jgi:acetyl-CoA carboxylase biotin carboxyl carrier protein